MTEFAPSAVGFDETAVDGEKTAVQILAEQTEGLKMNVTTTLQKFQLQCTSVKVIKTRVEASKEVDRLVAFVKTLNAAIGKTSRLTGLLEKMITADCEDEEIPKLLTLLDEVNVRYGVIQERAVRFNVQETTASKRGWREASPKRRQQH